MEAQGQTLRGWVVDEASSEALEGVTVLVAMREGPSLRVTTDAEGRFQMRLSGEGRYWISASRVGYMSLDSLAVEVGPAESVDVTLRMSVSAVALDPILVNVHRGVELRHLATFEGFLVRRERASPVGGERVVTRYDPEMTSAILVSDVLRWFPPSQCIQIFYDGRLERTRSAREISVSSLIGMEFYRHSIYAPLEFRDGSQCSVVALWSEHPRNRLPPR